ncbi:hypothetical protein GCM10009555_062470 [Acrocarpospora macrocephala]|uniref:Uncharacterized protein n=1 Tax=Acrocarpospora macrocephala TaxID=150177 RepID=A0A5M3WMF8_9ACTN|nr:hypothetical protein Amac_032860 [Acrocarpospora macrocephala]
MGGGGEQARGGDSGGEGGRVAEGAHLDVRAGGQLDEAVAEAGGQGVERGGGELAARDAYAGQRAIRRLVKLQGSGAGIRSSPDEIWDASRRYPAMSRNSHILDGKACPALRSPRGAGPGP